MRYPYLASSATSLANLRQRLLLSRPRTTLSSKQWRHDFFTAAKKRRNNRASLPLVILAGGLFVWGLYPTDDFAQLSSAGRATSPSQPSHGSAKTGPQQVQPQDESDSNISSAEEDQSAWAQFSRRFESFSLLADQHWASFPDQFVDWIVPEWSKSVPGYMRKLQKELSMAPGSLAEEIWDDAHDPTVNPEIRYSADVRISDDLCPEEKEYLERRRKVARIALAKYLDIPEKDIHPDDVPTIAMCGSGGGLRALIAGTGSMLATEEDGLFDCVTYTSGVSGSCWLQLLYLASFSNGSVSSLLEHLKARAGTHIAYPPIAFDALTSMPTSKYLLSGMVEKLKGDAKADFGLVDFYGLLLGARYLVPKGELGVDERDFKISNQRRLMKYGEFPLPIYTAVRHEIPDPVEDPVENKEATKRETWFQWYEITPYEFFCEEFGAGVPTWAMGRVFKGGKDVPPETGFHLPELRTPLLMGIFGSAFCATLSHYYKEIRPLVQGMSGMKSVDEMIYGRDEELSKVHPFDPASIPNFAYQMSGKLSMTTPSNIYDQKYIQLMDAGMSNNLPIYPLLRPGREVDVLIAFDASADIKTDNWLSVADGYARQRGIKGWPVGVGWPKPGESAAQNAQELEDAQAKSSETAQKKVRQAQQDQKDLQREADLQGAGHKGQADDEKYKPGNQEAGDLGYCTVWVGNTAERSSSPPPKSKAITEADSWKALEPDAGISVIYLPFLENPKVPDISPGTSEYLSTWNFIYTPEQIDKVVELARANYSEGKRQVKSTVRAVYERKKMLREKRETTKRNQTLEGIAKNSERAFRKEVDQFS